MDKGITKEDWLGVTMIVMDIVLIVNIILIMSKSEHMGRGINMKFNKILILFLLQFFLLSGFWAIDIGSSAMCWEQTYANTAQAQGLGFLRSANNQYHIGLGLVYIVFLIQTSWLLYIILNSKGNNNGINK